MKEMHSLECGRIDASVRFASKQAICSERLPFFSEQKLLLSATQGNLPTFTNLALPPSSPLGSFRPSENLQPLRPRRYLQAAWVLETICVLDFRLCSRNVRNRETFTRSHENSSVCFLSNSVEVRPPRTAVQSLSCCKHLMLRNKSRTLFSTHYHKLADYLCVRLLARS